MTEADLAVDAIAEGMTARHYFGLQHTQDRYETAFYGPVLSDWRNFETWAEAGALQTPERANRIWKAILEEFEAPSLDPAILEELDAFVARRKAEGGAPTDF
jgi:trimethylamine--corrinoid protein Co-methyltransferase